jgi:hypothetical protein
MTEEPGNKYGTFYGDPQGQPHGQPQAGPAQHPYASLFAAPPPEPDDGTTGGIGSRAVIVVVLLVVGVAGGVAYIGFGGGSLLKPRGAQAAAMIDHPRAVDAATSQVHTLRSQVALYRLQHQERLPTLAQLQDGWGVLVRRTYVEGSFVPDGAGPRRGPRASHVSGPYLQQPPVNPLTKSSKVVAAGNATADAGWTYDESTGYVWAVAPAETEPVRLARDYFEVVKPGQ